MAGNFDNIRFTCSWCPGQLALLMLSSIWTLPEFSCILSSEAVGIRDMGFYPPPRRKNRLQAGIGQRAGSAKLPEQIRMTAPHEK